MNKQIFTTRDQLESFFDSSEFHNASSVFCFKNRVRFMKDNYSSFQGDCKNLVDATLDLVGHFFGEEV